MTLRPARRYRTSIASLRVIGGLFALTLLCVGCTFDAPAGAPVDLALGAPCSDDRDCASKLCSASGVVGECVECKATTSCPAGRACDLASSRCLPIAGPTPPRHATTLGGERRRNAEGRVHVGRVAVIPVTTVTEPAR